jgi:hypothetical protein
MAGAIVAADVDEGAFGFLLAGAVHNLVVSGPAYPRLSRRQLRQRLEAIVARLRPHAPRGDAAHPGDTSPDS